MGEGATGDRGLNEGKGLMTQGGKGQHCHKV